ncbi:hypothetical protein [Sulfurisphaera ohwakuensis]|uniref:hypothetical protein n=1 Tax=Sulfurisphaera ohwakuensis TaxID=69656 RepID=UPI0036F2D43B
MLEEIEIFIFAVLSKANGKTIEEISDETGIREEVVKTILELLRCFDVVEEYNGKYYSKYREVAKLILDLKLRNIPDEYIRN